MSCALPAHDLGRTSANNEFQQRSGVLTAQRQAVQIQQAGTDMAHKAEHAVDMESGAVIAVTLQAADQGDTTTIKETLAETAENLAHLIEREAEKTPDGDPKVSLSPLAEIVADKGYHSSATVLAVRQAQAR